MNTLLDVMVKNLAWQSVSFINVIFLDRTGKVLMTYQNIVYKAASIPIMITEPTIKDGDTRKSFLSTVIVCSDRNRAGFEALIPIMINKITPKSIVMRSRNG